MTVGRSPQNKFAHFAESGFDLLLNSSSMTLDVYFVDVLCDLSHIDCSDYNTLVGAISLLPCVPFLRVLSKKPTFSTRIKILNTKNEYMMD